MPLINNERLDDCTAAACDRNTASESHSFPSMWPCRDHSGPKSGLQQESSTTRKSDVYAADHRINTKEEGGHQGPPQLFDEVNAGPRRSLQRTARSEPGAFAVDEYQDSDLHDVVDSDGADGTTIQNTPISTPTPSNHVWSGASGNHTPVHQMQQPLIHSPFPAVQANDASDDDCIVVRDPYHE